MGIILLGPIFLLVFVICILATREKQTRMEVKTEQEEEMIKEITKTPSRADVNRMFLTNYFDGYLRRENPELARWKPDSEVYLKWNGLHGIRLFFKDGTEIYRLYKVDNMTITVETTNEAMPLPKENEIKQLDPLVEAQLFISSGPVVAALQDRSNTTISGIPSDQNVRDKILDLLRDLGANVAILDDKLQINYD